MTESTLQQHCIEYLTIISNKNKELFFFAPLNETAMMILRMFKIDNKKCALIINFLKKMGMIPGVPDLQILYKGKSIFIELKKIGKSASENQIRIHFKILKAGFPVFIIDDFEKFRDCLFLELGVK